MNAPTAIAVPGWRLCRLGDVTEVIGGSTPSSSEPTYWDGDIVWITPTDLGSLSEQLIRKSGRKITDAGYRSCGAAIVPPGTVVMSSRAPIGHLGIASVPLCTNQGCKSFVPGPSLDSQFLFYALSYFRGSIQSLGSGNTFKEVKKSDLEAFTIPIPPLDEQKRISVRLYLQLNSLSGIYAHASEQLASVQALRNAVLLQTFRGILPLGTKANRVTAPDGWSWIPLSKLARLESGHTPSRRRPEWWGGDIPWIALPDIREADGKELFDTAKTTNEHGLANSAARLLPKGTVVMSRTASVGFVTVMGSPMATSQDFVNWVCGPDLDPWFLMWLLIASRSYLLGLASGAIHKTIYMPTVQSFCVCVPPIDEQRRLVERLREKVFLLDSAAATLQIRRHEIESLQPAFLRAAFLGNPQHGPT
jgi:type I restriction enzyme S subunit